MDGSKAPVAVLLMALLLASCLGSAHSFELLDVEEMLMEADDLGRSLLQTAETNGAYGGYGTYGGYGGYGQEAAQAPQFQEVTTYRTECTKQTNPTSLQVFVAMLQPTQPVNDAEVAQDSPSGMMTMYVDPRSGEAWVSGDINNVQNMTAVTVNAGNTTESGPVVLPLLPSASALNVDGRPTTVSNFTSNNTLIQALWNATFNSSGNNDNTNAATAGDGADNNAGSDNQAPSVTVMGFNPPLPWLSHMMFSQKVFTNASVPLLANATVNNSMGANNAGGNNNNNDNSASAGTTGTAESGATGGNNLAGNAIGVKPTGWVNLTEMINTLGNGNNTVITITKFTENGSVTETNITGGNNNARGVVPRAGRNNNFNAGDFNTTNVLALMQAGMTYVSVWTAQSGDNAELRGQFMPYGKVVGASPAISAAFPDALVPSPNYTETTCRQVPVVTRVRRPGAEAGIRGGAEDMRGRVTTDVFGQDVVGNNYTAQAQTTLPGVATAMANVTTRRDPNRKGNYSIFAAAVNAASRFLNTSSAAVVAGRNAANAAAAAGNQAQTGATNAAATGTNNVAAGANNAAANANQAAANTGRRLLQAAAGANRPSQRLNATQQAALAGTGGTGGVTVFAPTNDAIKAYLKTANVTEEQFLANKTLLLKVISFHINPNQALSVVDIAKQKYPTKAWKTLLPYNNIGYSTNSKGVATLYGAAGSSAKIVDANMRSGNVIVHGINKVLVPPVLAQNNNNNETTPRRLMEWLRGMFV